MIENTSVIISFIQVIHSPNDIYRLLCLSVRMFKLIINNQFGKKNQYRILHKKRRYAYTYSRTYFVVQKIKQNNLWKLVYNCTVGHLIETSPSMGSRMISMYQWKFSSVKQWSNTYKIKYQIQIYINRHIDRSLNYRQTDKEQIQYRTIDICRWMGIQILINR